DRNGKVVPRQLAFVRIVINPSDPFWRSDDLDDGLREIAGRGGGADLIVHHGNLIPLLHQANHRLYEIRAIAGIDRCCTDNNAVGSPLLDRLLSEQLGTAIYADRSDRIIFA